MSAVLFAVVAFTLLVLVVVFMFRPYDYGASLRVDRIGSDDDPDDAAADTKWRSVKVRPGLTACKRVEQISDQVFLSSEAPVLPLPYCTEPECRCHYLFMDDRRSGLDRRVEMARLGYAFAGSGSDRRRSPGRRIGDLAAV